MKNNPLTIFIDIQILKKNWIFYKNVYSMFWFTPSPSSVPFCTAYRPKNHIKTHTSLSYRKHNSQIPSILENRERYCLHSSPNLWCFDRAETKGITWTSFKRRFNASLSRHSYTYSDGIYALDVFPGTTIPSPFIPYLVIFFSYFLCRCIE